MHQRAKWLILSDKTEEIRGESGMCKGNTVEWKGAKQRSDCKKLGNKLAT